jgi:hypothetical protein
LVLTSFLMKIFRKSLRELAMAARKWPSGQRIKNRFPPSLTR